MSKIFELFGYRLDCWNEDAAINRATAWCPFMDSECDGGGNRHLSALDLTKFTNLTQYFPGKGLVQAGVCSLQLREGGQPWIVCPRRLLTLRGETHSQHQSSVRKELFEYAELEKDKSFRVWSEVKMKVKTLNYEDKSKSFDYTFDYIITGLERKSLSEVARLLHRTVRSSQNLAQQLGYTIAQRNGQMWIEDFPSDPIVIVEIMTSSTSGGDKKKRTQIPMAFEDAIINPSKHNAPTINYRQVWARMVSQLIVKSQVGIAWKGKTIWLVQDLLADYISSSTALELSRYIASRASEVNVLAFSYGDIDCSSNKPLANLKASGFYSGPISEEEENNHPRGFVEIVKIGAPPAKELLWASLFKKRHCGTFSYK